jgi:hypothetical protein
MFIALTMTDFSEQRFYECCQTHINIVCMGILSNCDRKNAVFSVVLLCIVIFRNITLLFNRDLLSYFVNVNSEVHCYIIFLVVLFDHFLHPYIHCIPFSKNLDLSLHCNETPGFALI